MKYELFLKFDGELDLNTQDYIGGLFETVDADIMYSTDEDAETAEAEDEDYEGTKIGFMQLLYFNQALAMAYGVKMNEVRYLTFQYNKQALMELDATCISQETINEIGATANPNIMVILRFGISAAWRNKGIGEQVLKDIIKQMKGKYGYIVILSGVPVQCGADTGPDSYYEREGVELAGLEEDPEKAQWKLNAFFQRCGFRQFKNYDTVFICNVDQAVAERYKVKQSVI